MKKFNYQKNIHATIKANEIIKLFIENEIPLHQQLEILKLAKQKIEFCRNDGAEMKQKSLNL
jgi:hypothetical protein